MTAITISIRRARPDDAHDLTKVFDGAWREAYQGLLPAIALERMIGRRGPRWWMGTATRGRPLVVLDVGESVVGYVAYGRVRDKALPADGEIDELYLAPEYQGLGFGKRLFKAVRNDLDDRGAKRVAVWCLSDNARGCEFYRRLGGRMIAETTERFGGVGLTKSCFLFR